MEVTRQLLTERAGKTGLSRIQLTFCWDSQRLRLGSGQKCHPKDWDAKRELLKTKTGAAGTYVDTVNRVLETYAAAAHAAHHEAQLSGQRLPPAQMKAAILRHYARLGEEQAGLVPIPASTHPYPAHLCRLLPPVAGRAGPAHQPAHRPAPEQDLPRQPG